MKHHEKHHTICSSQNMKPQTQRETTASLSFISLGSTSSPDTKHGDHLKPVTLKPISQIFWHFPRFGVRIFCIFRVFRVFALGIPQTLISLGRGLTKGWFPKGWFWRMFPRNENRNEGTFAKTTLLETALLSPSEPFWC